MTEIIPQELTKAQKHALLHDYVSFLFDKKGPLAFITGEADTVIQGIVLLKEDSKSQEYPISLCQRILKMDVSLDHGAVDIRFPQDAAALDSAIHVIREDHDFISLIEQEQSRDADAAAMAQEAHRIEMRARESGVGATFNTTLSALKRTSGQEDPTLAAELAQEAWTLENNARESGIQTAFHRHLALLKGVADQGRD